ncbi:MAG: hypothetical protein Greene041619_524 [Candidatus Peregrinibacteria bacterium Greene0416_19]|nr:MAG: hypothetical protein Greene041619_524 [Candidatus Peregrinibacteria bacterium Greene0416_19]
MRSSQRRGLTLVEILIVVAILAILLSVVLIKTNARKHFRFLAAAQRKSHVLQLQKALSQAIVAGKVPQQQIPAKRDDAKWICQYSYRGLDCTDYPVQGVDFSFLVPDYLSEIPVDPEAGTGAITGYKVFKDGPFFVIITPPAAAPSSSSSL